MYDKQPVPYDFRHGQWGDDQMLTSNSMRESVKFTMLMKATFSLSTAVRWNPRLVVR